MYNSSCYNAQYYYMHIRVETQFLSMKKQTLSQLLHLLSKKKKKNNLLIYVVTLRNQTVI